MVWSNREHWGPRGEHTFKVRGITGRVPEDNGCRLHPSCLGCPRPVCIYDVPLQVQLKNGAIARVMGLVLQGCTNVEVAEQLGLSVRTVQRYVNIANKEGQRLALVSGRLERMESMVLGDLQ